MPPSSLDVFQLIDVASKRLGVDADLAHAICVVESGGNPLAVRFEPAWKYFQTPEAFAFANGISQDTEKTLQAISWGPMQIMGSVCRELGYRGPLVSLTSPDIAIRYSLMKLKALTDKYEDESFAISAYNCGTPKKGLDGKFGNQGYVDKVMARLKVLRRIA